MDTIIVNIAGEKHGKYKLNRECPNCGEDRTSGYFFRGAVYRGSIRIASDQWQCRCGNVDSYNYVHSTGQRVGWDVPTTLKRVKVNQ